MGEAALRDPPLATQTGAVNDAAAGDQRPDPASAQLTTVLIDEYCFFDSQEEELAAIEAACKRIHIVSSGNGAGDHAHKLWRAADKGEGL